MVVPMMGMAILWRCPYYDYAGVYIIKVSILWRCP